MNAPKNLDELREMLISGEDWHGMPLDNGGRVDLANMPTFGGNEPECTLGIISWDEDCIMMGDDDYPIVTREEYAEYYD